MERLRFFGLAILAIFAVALSKKPAGSDLKAVEIYARGSIRSELLDIESHHSDEEDGSYDRAELEVSDRAEVSDEAEEFPVSTTVGTGLDGGVAEGACKNFKKNDKQKASVSCPAPLKMVGCSCRDKVGENVGSCGSKFSNGETCTAYTKLQNSVTAYARCCHMDWATNFTIKESKISDPLEDATAVAACDADHILLGCACIPGDAPNNGCKHTTAQDNSSCLAVNLKDHKAGVKAQALCAVLPNSSQWETVQQEVKDQVSTNLTCSQPFPKLQMLSCTCGSQFGTCNGGKVIANKCECFGKVCNATGRCADIPIPPRDCIWNIWGEWSDCSVSCGNGTQSRIREIAMVASHGGGKCTGPVNATIACQGDGSKKQCNMTREEEVVLADSFFHANKMMIMSGIGAVVFVVLGIGGAMYRNKRNKDEGGEEQWGGGYGGYGGYGEGGGYGGYGEGQGGGQGW